MPPKKRTRVPESLVKPDVLAKYVSLLHERKLTEAEKTLEEVRGAFPDGSSQWNAGYLKALEGLLLSRKSNDDTYLYLNRIEPTAHNFRKLQREFARSARSVLHGDYDRGYFQALAECSQIFEKLSPEPDDRKKR